ncbi:MAG: chromosome partitioning protein ParB [Flavobacteriales bacterium]|jgi:ParB family transcriptional regulator, chromosome partitioning protein|nr:chromosome partitioning protein ParB [Flavobacteriales bacterium]|tara:strand:+ start:3747 stop:4658 length:912 start_codon:yes stop_codon:yes gene_type:complete
MTKEKGVLGRGLASILGSSNTNLIKNPNQEKEIESSAITGITHEILICQIVPNPFQPRIKFDQEKLNELAISIEQLGIIQPITVRKMKEGEFQLISGERRFKAAKIAGLDKIPAYIRIANDKEMLEMALVENIQRENLNPIEVALSYQRLIKEIQLTQEQCSIRVGKNRSTISNFLRLLKLPEIIQKALIDGTISNGHARSLLSITSKESQINLCQDIIANGYSVREVEQLSKEFSTRIYKRTSKNKSIPTPLPFLQQKMAHDLSKNINTPIELKRNKKGRGKLIITFNDDEDLIRIIEKISN